MSEAREALLHPEKYPHLRGLVHPIINALQYFQEWSLEHVAPERNRVAQVIATSVTRDHRYQSYVATGGPRWLNDCIRREALA